MRPNPPAQLLKQADKLWLFLDYDGTLANFAPTPDDVLPDMDLIDLLSRLVKRPETRVAVISGRRLGHVQKLVPVPGVLLAGTYGVELQVWDGNRIDQVEYEKIRPTLEKIRPEWAGLIERKSGFYLEDKGYALAIHAAQAADEAAETILEQATQYVEDEGISEPFRLLSGHKFLELVSKLANKGMTIRYLLDNFPWPGSTLIYFGDDDKDELAFEAINEAGGISIVVSDDEERQTAAEYQFCNPEEVRELLWEVVRG